VRALLSTRLFAAAPLDEWHVRFARRHGFPSLELYASPRHLNLLGPGEPERLRDLVRSEDAQAPWLHVGRELLARLVDPGMLHRFSLAVETLGVRVVTATLRSWPRPKAGAMLDLSDLLASAGEAGARLVVDVDRLDARSLRKLEYGVGICWDLGGPTLGMQLDKAEIDDLLEHVNRGRLHAVRASHRLDHHRDAPGPREALLLEEAWRLHAPGTLVYDVDDPTGFGSLADYEAVMADLHAFHSGEMRPPHGGTKGGFVWGALAPG